MAHDVEMRSGDRRDKDWLAKEIVKLFEVERDSIQPDNKVLVRYAELLHDLLPGVVRVPEGEDPDAEDPGLQQLREGLREEIRNGRPEVKP